MKYSEWTLLPVGICLAIGASVITGQLSGPRAEAKGGGQEAARLQANLQAMQLELSGLSANQERLEARLEALALQSPAATNRRSAIGQADLAVARWMRDNAPALGLDAGSLGGAEERAEANIEAVVLKLLGAELSWSEREAKWTEVSQNGQLKAVLEVLEDLAARAPGDADLLFGLADGYARQIDEVGLGPLKVIHAEQADKAFDRVLELDAKHWDARFGKALTLSRQPSMLGKSGEAIAQFQKLIEQQESQASEERFARSYFFLGNMYNERGQQAEAKAAWRRGLERFPGDEALQAQLDSNARGQL